MKVLSVASELYPLVKTGGLADVAAALPAALVAEGVEVRALVPGYPAVLAALSAAEEVLRFPALSGGPARVLAGAAFVLDAPHLFARPGPLYGHPDDAERFAALGWAAAEIGRGAIGGFTPDVIHAHDWQAGLTPAYLHYSEGRRPGTVFTVHNLAFQGVFPADRLSALGLPPTAFAIEGVEYYGGIGFLKAGIRLADRVSTVSSTYADEIRTDAAGMGLGGLLRSRGEAFTGILNGIDTAVWDPGADPHLPARYDAGTLDARAANKAALQAALGLAAEPGALLVGVISRLAWQKGLDLLLAALPHLLRLCIHLVVLGAGEPALEAGLAEAAAAHPGRVAVRLGHDEALAHLIQGGADMIAVPSRFEPCGLTQLCALRYGALPLVARVGGLADTVIDANPMAQAAGTGTGFLFAGPEREPLEAALSRAAGLWRNAPAWRRLQANAMATDVSWAGPARQYATLYCAAVAARGG